MTAALTRFAPLVGISLLFAVGLGFRTWLQRHRYGHSGVILFQQAGTWARLRDGLLLVLPALLIALVAGQAVAPGSVAVGRLSGLEHASAVWLGTALLTAAIGLLTAAQLQMGKSWRIGIDEGARPGLVTWGLYRYCRNPIFAAMLTALLGLFLLTPSGLLLLLLGLTYAGIRRQVAEEERYLRHAYGADYSAYAAQVGRFTPWLGRLA